MADTVPLNDGSTRNEYTATGGQTIFPYTFFAMKEADIKVYQNGTLLTLTTHYTIDVVQDVDGGNVTLVTGATLNDEIVITLVPDIERQTEFQTSGTFKAVDLNLELTYILSTLQYLSTIQDRQLTLAEDTVYSGSLNLPEPVADTLLAWNSAGNDLVNTSQTISEIVAASSVSIKWTFDTATAMADPGTGDIRLNNAAPASTTAIAVSANTADNGNPDLSSLITTIDDSTSGTKALLYLRKNSDPATYAIYTLDSAVTDNTTWLQMAVTHVASAGTWAASDVVHMEIARVGDKGDAGGLAVSDIDGQTEDVVAAADNFVYTKAGALKRDTVGGILDLVGAYTKTLTNTTIDANGTGNSISNIDVADLAVGTDGELITWDAAGNPATVGAGTSGQVLTSNGAGAAPTMQDAAAGGKVVQQVYASSGTQVSGATAMPDDNTIPQNTEGNEIITLAITPTNASNILLIECVGFAAGSADSQAGFALFKDSDASAIAATQLDWETGGTPSPFFLRHRQSAGDTSAQTFKLRAGLAAGTIYISGDGTQKFGGVGVHSIMITEINNT